MRKNFRTKLLVCALAAATSVMLVGCGKEDTATTAAPTEAASTQVTEQAKAAYDYMVLVNKAHKLPDDWESKVVLKEATNRYGETYKVEEKALEQFEKLQKECADEGI